MVGLTRYDKFLIIGLIVLALASLVAVRYMAGGTDTIVVQVDGREAIRASLNEDQRFTVHGPLGVTEIEVKDRRARVVDSKCRKKTCVHTGWIDKPYQTIICAPNRVVISLIGSDDEGEVDGITG